VVGAFTNLQIFPVNYAQNFFLRPGVQMHLLHPMATPMSATVKTTLTNVECTVLA